MSRWRRALSSPGSVHDVRVTVRPSAATRRVRLLLVSVGSLGVLLFGIVAMHAQMAAVDVPASGGTMAVAGMPTYSGHVRTVSARGASADAMRHAMGDMSAMDCLLMGMICLFGPVTVLLVLMLTGRLRLLLRRLLAARVRVDAGGLRPAEPPSLLLLSICRT